MLLFAYYADALLNVASIYSLIDHCDGVVGVADHALTLGIECQFLAAEDVLAGARTVCPEITGRADISPLDILGAHEARPEPLPLLRRGV